MYQHKILEDYYHQVQLWKQKTVFDFTVSINNFPDLSG